MAISSILIFLFRYFWLVRAVNIFFSVIGLVDYCFGTILSEPYAQLSPVTSTWTPPNTHARPCLTHVLLLLQWTEVHLVPPACFPSLRRGQRLRPHPFASPWTAPWPPPYPSDRRRRRRKLVSRRHSLPPFSPLRSSPRGSEGGEACSAGDISGNATTSERDRLRHPSPHARHHLPWPPFLSAIRRRPHHLRWRRASPRPPISVAASPLVLPAAVAFSRGCSPDRGVGVGGGLFVLGLLMVFVCGLAHVGFVLGLNWDTRPKLSWWWSLGLTHGGRHGLELEPNPGMLMKGPMPPYAGHPHWPMPTSI